MQSSVSRQSPGNFRVTLQTFQSGLPAKFVAARAIRGSIQRLMWTG